MKVFVVVSGMCGVTDMTSLSQAPTPFLDKFASGGRCGVHTPLGAHLAPTVESALIALLGNDTFSVPCARGPLEAFGARMQFNDGDLVLSCGLGSLMERKLIDRAAGGTLSYADAEQLLATLQEEGQLDYPFRFSPIGSGGVLVIEGNFSSAISNVDPLYKKEGTFGVAQKDVAAKVFQARALDSDSKSTLAATTVNALVKDSYRVLKDHQVNVARNASGLLPANVLLPSQAGITLPQLKKFSGYAAVCSPCFVRGVARLSSMRVLQQKPLPYVLDFRTRCRKLLRLEIALAKKHLRASHFDSYFVYFSAVALASAAGDSPLKKELLATLDKKFFKFLWRRRKELQLLVTGDCAMSSTERVPSAKPVPLLHYGGPVDGVTAFSKDACLAGDLGSLEGKDVLSFVDF